MIRYLIRRPVAVFLSFGLLLVLGLYYFRSIPVSLLPPIDVPRIIITLSYPGHTASQVESSALRSLREGLLTTSHLVDIQSRASNHRGSLYLQFEHGTRMDLAYVEVNEKIDRLSQSLPRDLPRPQVNRVNTSDIPVVRLHVLPDSSGPELATLTDLAEKILKKRLEQLEGVGTVDINGQVENIIVVQPDQQALQAAGLQTADIGTAIRNANQELGSLSIRDGQYRYFVRLAQTLHDPETIRKIPVQARQGSIPLDRLCRVDLVPEPRLGYHVYQDEEGLVLTIKKQAGARMHELMPRLYDAIGLLRKDYPGVRFEISQDQSFLLVAGIDNLKQDILYGGILTIALLFLFLGHWSAPSLMSISIPLSLVIGVVFFYLFGLSFNIISLSGLALGIGMLIDNSIVVIDHISRKRKSGLSLEESAVSGTVEMAPPVISQVLTTVVVYAPLVLLHGMAGDLIGDQAKALTISLFVSLLIAFGLAPLLYKVLLSRLSRGEIREDTVFYRWVEKGYHRMIRHILRYRPIYFVLTLLMMPAGFWIARFLPVRALPETQKTESLIRIDWNEPIDAGENRRRHGLLTEQIRPFILASEADIGITQYLLQDSRQTVQQGSLYYACSSDADRSKADEAALAWVRTHFPAASLELEEAPNAFTQLFSSSVPYFEARFTNVTRGQDSLISGLAEKMANTGALPGEGLASETHLEILPDYPKMALYGIDRQTLDQVLEQHYGSYKLTELQNASDRVRVNLVSERNENQAPWLRSSNGQSYPLSLFVQFRYRSQPKQILADRSGQYHNLIWPDGTGSTVEELKGRLSVFALDQGIPVHFSGRYFEDQKQLGQLVLIFLLVVLLMYVILAIQYESLVQPILVMLTIPLGITGSMLLLWATGSSLDTMAAIGFIVILGLIVDDPILKIETLNRLSKAYKSQGLPLNEETLSRMIHEAGGICLKPLLMVSLTTSLALVPVLFIPGLGNELQKPLVWVIIGGLTIGTFFTTWFIPLAYWYWIRMKGKFMN
ncbi:MAG TPA: efflux RND transporter permease subunit [Saprospiraceae bacterium]|nr:efflux RND transporter permease subunit [Saprospiraceae bacterium]HNT21464.1 efflux RND transporter permease subunit [Saprospiraceae bacterium]